ncbi:hypothetical protein [Streptomyces sp. NPDC055681]
MDDYVGAHGAWASPANFTAIRRLRRDAPLTEIVPEGIGHHAIIPCWCAAARRIHRVGNQRFADLKNWRILTKVRMNARQATMLLRALLVLTNAEVQR